MELFCSLCLMSCWWSTSFRVFESLAQDFLTRTCYQPMCGHAYLRWVLRWLVLEQDSDTVKILSYFFYMMGSWIFWITRTRCTMNINHRWFGHMIWTITIFWVASTYRFAKSMTSRTLHYRCFKLILADWAYQERETIFWILQSFVSTFQKRGMFGGYVITRHCWFRKCCVGYCYMVLELFKTLQ